MERILNVDISSNSTIPSDGGDTENSHRNVEEDPIKKYGIVLDPDHPDFSQGTGRLFYLKWANRAYSESTYEYERDLILNGVDYLVELASFELRAQKPTKDDMKARVEAGNAEKERLRMIYKSASDHERESMIKEYQLNLEKNVFKNGGQLRNYQAEGVAWLMANYINQRGSILADEMGLGKLVWS